MNRAFLLAACLILGAILVDAAAAGTNHSTMYSLDPTRLGNTRVPDSMSELLLGNPNPPAQIIPDWIQGNEELTYEFECTQCLPSELGFAPATVYLLMDFGPEDVPADFEVRSGMAEPVHAGMPVPIYIQCISPAVSIHLEEPGTYAIAAALDSSSTECCAYIKDYHTGYPYSYCFFFQIITEFPENKRPNAVTDSSVYGWRSLFNRGEGWTYLYSVGVPGEFILWADGDYCDHPMGVESTTWGGIKALYGEGE